MDDYFLYPPTDEQHVRAWLRAHRDDYRSPITGRYMAALLAHAAAKEWGITERSSGWQDLLRWTYEETR